MVQMKKFLSVAPYVVGGICAVIFLVYPEAKVIACSGLLGV